MTDVPAEDDSTSPYATGPGRAHPPGATVRDDGVNFSVFSEHATGVELLLFDEHDDIATRPGHPARPAWTTDTFHFWHV